MTKNGNLSLKGALIVILVVTAYLTFCAWQFDKQDSKCDTSASCYYNK